jgi:hypothetical protein
LVEVACREKEYIKLADVYTNTDVHVTVDAATDTQEVENYLKLLLAVRDLPETKRCRTFMDSRLGRNPGRSVYLGECRD